MRPKLRFSAFILTALIALIPLAIMAAKTGTIAGIVIDQKTGNPIPGASVQLTGTTRGAITDPDGRFEITGIAPGLYQLNVVSVSFCTLQLDSIRVWADSTTKLAIEMQASVTDLHRVIKVTATKDRIDKYKVSSEVNVSKDVIKKMPAVSVDELVRNSSGVVTSSEGEVIIRGGRAGEVQCITDGQSIGDPLGGYGPVHGGTHIVNGEPYDATFYKDYGTNPFVDTEDDNFSTFAIDVDDASFIKARNYLEQGHLPPDEAVRAEEFINHFDYGYQPPLREPFAVHIEGAPSPFGDNCQLLRIGIKGREIDEFRRRSANLIFVVDVSGSMATENRLELVKKALRMLVDELRRDDKVGIVVYGSRGRELLQLTSNKCRIRAAISSLESGGSTNAEEGLKLGYQMADRHFSRNKINRLILCSDGVANVGTTRAEDLLNWIKEYADRGITLSSIGFGMTNYNDILLEKLGNKGNGHYAYVDGIDEAHRVFVENLTGMLQVIARDVKIQVDFNPDLVRSYRLIGYENRDVADNKFRDDKEDGGEIGAGHSVTALYEIKFHRNVPRGQVADVFIRFKAPDELREAEEIQFGITGRDFHRRFQSCTPEFKLAAAAAEFAEILGKSYWAKGGSLSDVFDLANRVHRQTESQEVRELVDLILLAERLQDQRAER